MPHTSIWSNPGVYYGFDRHGTEKFYKSDRHVITIGPNGSGKSKRALVPALARIAKAGWSALIADVNDELTPMLAPYFEALGYEVVILAPFSDKSRGFNPVASMAIDVNMPDNALGHAAAIIKAAANTHQPHFPNGAADLWAGLEMYVRLVIENGSLGAVRDLLSKGTKDLQDLILAPHIEYGGKRYPGILRAAKAMGWPEMAAKVNRYSDINASNNELLGIISTGLVESRWLDSRPIRKDLEGPPFDFKVMKQRKVVVFLRLPPRRLTTQSSWLRTVVTSAVQDLMEDVTKAKVPCLIALDEFFAIAEGGFDVILKNMQMFRKYSLKLYTIFQDLSQAKRLLGNDGFETFFANAGLVISFAPTDLATAKYLSDRSGQTTKQSLSVNESRSRQAGSMPSKSESSSWAQIAQPVLLPQDIRGMSADEVLVLSHEIENGIGRFRMPYPTEIKGLEGMMSRDPTR